MSYVYLKLQKHSGSSATIDTIPLKVNSVNVSVDKTIPAIPIPLSGLATGESTTVALDLGMSNKRISLTGIIVDTEIRRSHTKSGGSATNLTFTAQEVAQMIASGVDSTGLASYQAINELVVLMDSKVDENYAARASTIQIPLTFRARGSALEKDNTNVVGSFAFPTSSTSKGLNGFIQSFSYEMTGETIEVSFSLEFVVANVLP
ncbi:MAG TPA: hypothetical protein DCM10_11815 [Xanthomarina gelatinilytica]|nr:hypothetical protein [Xanthomarina gelatinilytica]|tara:strand:+ start:3310 stop:3924 length:615 start_codon:yes stop_codon:yes gene_type:complete